MEQVPAPSTEEETEKAENPRPAVSQRCPALLRVPMPASPFPMAS